MFNLLNKNVQSASKIENIPQKEKVSGKQFFLFAAALGLHYLCTMNYLEVFGALVGLIYLWLEYRASIYLWLACIVMPAIYLVVYYQAGLYADFGINVYYLLASVYGWIAWSRGRKKKNIQQAEEETPITTHAAQGIFPLDSRVYSVLGGYRLDIDYMDRQLCALDGQFHYGTEHHSHVDAGPQICGAVGSLDDCGLGVLRTVHLQGAVFHFGTLRALCGSGLFRMEKMAEPDGGTGM